MKKNKIIISSYDDIKNPYYGGGGAIAIHELSKRIKDIYDVVVLTWNHSSNKNEIIDGVIYKRIGWPINPKLGMLLFQVSLPILSLTNKCDLWLESYGPPFTTSFLPVFRKPVIGMVHMLAAEDMTRKYGKFPFKLIERMGIRTYESIVTTNEYTKEKILQINKNAHVEVIANGIEKIPHLKTKKTKNILYLGRIEIDQKGLDLLLHAFKKFIDHGNKDYKLVIAGNGASGEVRKLNQIIKANNLKKYVIYKGRVIGQYKTNLLNRSCAVVIPSRFETYSMVALEAMAHGLPIVCFDIDGLKWVSKKASVKAKCFNVEDFTKAIEQILLSKEKTKQMRDYGPKYAKNFTWDNISQKYRSYISSQIANV